MEDREHEPQVAGDRRLQGEQRLDRALDVEEEVVDLVVEGDHLVGELDVALLERPDGPANRGEDPLALLLELRLDPVESLRRSPCATPYTCAARDSQGTSPLRNQPVTGPYPTRSGPAVRWPRTPEEEEHQCRNSALRFASPAAVAAAALLAIVAAGAAQRKACEAQRRPSRAPAARSSRRSSRSGSRRRLRLRLRAPVQRRRLGRRHRRDHGPHRRLRRERRAADARSVHRLQRLRPDPVGARRNVDHVQPARRQEPPAHGRPDAREDLHGQDHDAGTTRRSRSSTQGVSLPSTTITIAHRSDGSGTTYNFTDYLSSVSPAWKSQIGIGTSVNWPVGVGGRGSAGVAAIVALTAGRDRLRRRRVRARRTT